MTNRKEGEAPVNLPKEEVILPIGNDKLIELQKEDKFCKNILNMLTSNKLHNKNPYYIEDGVLKGTLMTISRGLRLLYYQLYNWLTKGWVIMEYLEPMPY